MKSEQKRLSTTIVCMCKRWKCFLIVCANASTPKKPQSQHHTLWGILQKAKPWTKVENYQRRTNVKPIVRVSIYVTTVFGGLFFALFRGRKPTRVSTVLVQRIFFCTCLQRALQTAHPNICVPYWNRTIFDVCFTCHLSTFLRLFAKTTTKHSQVWTK